MQHDLCFIARTKSSSYIPLSAKKKKHYSDEKSAWTSGKNFIKITSVGMGAAKSNENKVGMVMSVNSGTWLLHFFQPA